jgi:putative transposase
VEERGALPAGTLTPCPLWNLVNRNFAAAAPDRIWTADITYLRTTDEGFLYLAFILDVYSKRVDGWSMSTHLKTELVIDVLEMALWRRKPAAGLIHHADRGVQYAALSFGKRLEEAGIVPSIGRAGSAVENAVSESFVASLKTELLHRHHFPSREMVRTAVFDYIEGFYNRQRDTLH